MRDAPYGHIPVNRFLDVVCIDSVGHFPEDSRGHTDVCVMCDLCTKWVVAAPSKGQTAHDAVESLIEFVVQTGSFPRRVHSERGSAFNSDVFQALCARFGIQQSMTAAYNPRGNGAAEAQVGNICRIIRKAIQGRSGEWANAARWASFAYNTSYNFTIGCSLYFARHGREAVSPATLLLPGNGETTIIPDSINELYFRVHAIEASIRSSLGDLEK